ncbi:hypothetical protein [Sphingomonas sp. Y38-1Y]|uniref:hypothetical protein n=1 Tax=Sphingomonas sp. Y38-1Y TaxID=3078265 RepID=UPI0028ECAEF7|nr:hypothetical protein [Sphingomonas sp. Y38-1Y]
MSGKGLVEKLGVKPGMTLAVDGVPASLASLLESTGSLDSADTLLLFVADRAAAPAAIARGVAAFAPGKRLWFGYPKKSGAHASDISRDAGWERLAEADFLAVTQIALDADWSALRFRPRAEIVRLTRASGRG